MAYRYKNESNIDTCYEMDEHWKYFERWKKPVIEGFTVGFSLCEVSKRGKSIEGHYSICLGMALKGRLLNRESLLIGMGFLFGKCSKIECGDGCLGLCIY